LGAKIRRKNVKRDILHKNIASEYDILQEMAFQNAIFYIITQRFKSVVLTFIIEKCSFLPSKVIEKCKKPAVSAFSSL